MTKSVGKNVPRLDGFGKVTGETRYLDDLKIPNCWWGSAVRSPIPYGKIKGIKYADSFDWDQVVTCTYKDIPGRNATIFITEEQPILAKEYVRHVGEAVVLVAAPTRELLEEAKKNIEVVYDELDPVLSVKDSENKKAIIWGDDNIQSHYHIIKGDIKKGFEEADYIIEGEYKTGFHEHAYIEPQGAIGMPREDGGLTLLASAQCPYYVLKTLKAVFDQDETRINVVQTTMGGAFGGKEDYPSVLASYAGLLAIKAKKPVKVTYEREEDMDVTPKRHPSITTHKTGVKKDGTITAMEIDFKLEGGAYATVSQVVLSRGVIHAAGPYKCENVESRAACFATNQVPTGAYRGFGAPQSFFASEIHMDRVAEKIGMNPYEFRLINCVHVGDTLSTTQVLKEGVGAEESLRKVADSSSFVSKWEENRKPNNSNIKKGIGLSLYMHGGAFTGSGEAVMKSKAGIRLEEDGHVSILMANTDMGQGCTTVLPQITADALKMDVQDVSCVVPDTAVVPDSGPTVASRTTMIIGMVMENCAPEFHEKILNFVAEEKGLSLSEIDFHDGAIFKGDQEITSLKDIAKDYIKKNGSLEVYKRYDLPPGIKWDPKKHLGDAYPAYSWAADIAEVEVDMDTFEVSVDKMTLAVELGKAINPVLVEGQMEGGTLQALGWGIMEDVINKDGKVLNNKFQTYLIPTVLDTPDWDTHIIEKGFSAGPQGAKGIGELPHDGAAPAISNAIYNATGIRFTDLPMTPEKLFEMSKKEGEK